MSSQVFQMKDQKETVQMTLRFSVLPVLSTSPFFCAPSQMSGLHLKAEASFCGASSHGDSLFDPLHPSLWKNRTYPWLPSASPVTRSSSLLVGLHIDPPALANGSLWKGMLGSAATTPPTSFSCLLSHQMSLLTFRTPGILVPPPENPPTLPYIRATLRICTCIQPVLLGGITNPLFLVLLPIWVSVQVEVCWTNAPSNQPEGAGLVYE